MPRERERQRRAFAHLHQGVERVGAQGLVRQGLGRRLQALEDGHAGRAQHGQRGGKPRRVVAAHQATHHRQAQPGGIPAQAQRALAHGQAQAQAGRSQRDQQQPAPVPHKVAEAQHAAREQGQLALAAGEHPGHLRHHRGHEEDHDRQRHQRDDGRVERCADQLAAQLLLRFEFVGQALEHRAQLPAVLASGDHGAVDGGELVRKLRQRTAQAVAGIDFGADGRHQVALAFVLGLVGQGRERALHRQATAHQARELARPHGALAGTESAAGRADGSLPPGQGGFALVARSGADGLDLQRHQALRAQLPTRGTRAVGFQRALAGLAVGLQGFEAVGAHAGAVFRGRSRSHRPGRSSWRARVPWRWGRARRSPGCG